MDEKQVVGRVMKAFDQDAKPHRQFSLKADESYRAYRGIIERRSDADTWNNKQHPPYVLQVIETMVAGLIDPSPAWKVRPRPRLASGEERQTYADGAKALEYLLAYQCDIDRFAEKQRLLYLQALICRLTVAKNWWRSSEGTVKGRRMEQVPQYNANGDYLGTVPQLKAYESVEMIQDDPTCEPVDVRDFIWHEAATSIDNALRVTHRLWYSFDELKRLEKAGVYRNVDGLSETQDFNAAAASREQVLFQSSRTKDMVEVLEQWWYDEDGLMRVSTVGNRNVLLSDKPNPFWHGGFPFVVCSAMPDLFRIPGISEVEVIQDIQEMIWTLKNQSLDAIQLVTNPVVAVSNDVDDPGAYEFAPGEVWPMDRADQVQVIGQPQDVTVAADRAVLELKNDLQNIPGASPTLLGQIDPSAQTATEISLTTSLAQRRLAAKKSQFQWFGKRIGEMWLALDQQFIVEDRLVEIVGRDGEPDVFAVAPDVIQGKFHIAVQSMDESLMRQERRAEQQAKLQLAATVAPVFAAVQQPLNMKAFMDDYLDSFDTADKERYYASQPQPQMPQPGQQPQGDPSANGVTAPQATDANSPSNANSQSPVVFQQRADAMGGGAINLPGVGSQGQAG